MDDGIKRFKGINEILNKYNKIVKNLKVLKPRKDDKGYINLKPTQNKNIAENSPNTTPCFTPDMIVKNNDKKLNENDFQNLVDRVEQKKSNDRNEQIPSPFSDNKMNSRENIDLNVK